MKMDSGIFMDCMHWVMDHDYAALHYKYHKKIGSNLLMDPFVEYSMIPAFSSKYAANIIYVPHDTSKSYEYWGNCSMCLNLEEVLNLIRERLVIIKEFANVRFEYKVTPATYGLDRETFKSLQITFYNNEVDFNSTKAAYFRVIDALYQISGKRR